ncbi:MAG: class I SAM-dependent methyltransferase [Nanoarchaeota archaeon]
MGKFVDIKKEYDNFYMSEIKNGKLLAKDTCVGFWGPSVSDEVYQAFRKLSLGRFTNFLDLGSGDGKVTLMAALFCKNSTGIEYDPILTGKAIDIRDKLQITNAKFINDDFFNHDISAYDVIFHAPDQPLHRGVEDKLIGELKGKLIIHGHHFHPSYLKKERSFKVNDTLFSVYSK